MTDDLFTPSLDLFSSTSNPSTESTSERQLEKPADALRKRSIGNDKDRAEMWGEAGGSALMDLYRNDPLVRAAIDGQLAQERQEKAQSAKDSNLIYDELGNLLGVKSVGRAINTAKGGAELMAAIRKDIARKYGITE